MTSTIRVASIGAGRPAFSVLRILLQPPPGEPSPLQGCIRIAQGE